jgi:hypothetical protein
MPCYKLYYLPIATCLALLMGLVTIPRTCFVTSPYRRFCYKCPAPCIANCPATCFVTSPATCLVFAPRDFLAWLLAVLRIHKVLLRIRMRIHGSIPPSNGSGCASGSCHFPQWSSWRQQKIIVLLINLPLHHFSKIKRVIKKSQNSRNQCFSYNFCYMIEGSGSPKNIWIYESGSGSATLVIRYLLSGWGSLSPPVLDHSQYGHRFVLGIRTPVQEQRVMNDLFAKSFCFFLHLLPVEAQYQPFSMVGLNCGLSQPSKLHLRPPATADQTVLRQNVASHNVYVTW